MTAVKEIRVYKDTFTPSRPWQADVHWPDGKIWKAWSYGFRTKTALLQHIAAVAPDAKVVA